MSKLHVVFCSPENNYQEVHQTCNMKLESDNMSWNSSFIHTCDKVPKDQAINSHDGADWIVCNVEDCHDDVDEGEDKANE